MSSQLAPTIVAFIENLSMEGIGPSNKGKGVIAELLDLEGRTLLYLYHFDHEQKVNGIPREQLRQYRFHEITDELFRLEFFFALRQNNILYEVLEGCPPHVSAFSIDAPYKMVEHKLSEIEQKYYDSVY